MKSFLPLLLTVAGVGYLYATIQPFVAQNATFIAPHSTDSATVQQIKIGVIYGIGILAALWIVAKVMPNESVVKVDL